MPEFRAKIRSDGKNKTVFASQKGDRILPIRQAFAGQSLFAGMSDQASKSPFMSRCLLQT